MKCILLSLLLFISINSVAVEKTKLRWGADIESGAPFAYKDPKNPEKIIGLEKSGKVCALAHLWPFIFFLVLVNYVN